MGKLHARFLDSYDPVHVDIVKHLLDAAGPANFDLLYEAAHTESEMYPAITGGSISDSGGYLIPLRATVFCRDAYLRADPYPIAFCSHQFQQNPVVVPIGDVMKQFDRPVQDSDHCVHTSVIVDISEGGSAVWGFLLEIRAGVQAYILEFPVAEVTKH